MGRLSLRPNASIEYYKLNEKGYTETGGGGAFDLTVRNRISDETAANALLALGYDFGAATRRGLAARRARGRAPRDSQRFARQTTASFGDGDPFTLTPKSAPAAGAARLRFIGGGSPLSFAAEAQRRGAAEQALDRRPGSSSASHF